MNYLYAIYDENRKCFLMEGGKRHVVWDSGSNDVSKAKTYEDFDKASQSAKRLTTQYHKHVKLGYGFNNDTPNLMVAKLQVNVVEFLPMN